MEARTAVIEGRAHLHYPEEFPREVTLQEKQPPRSAKRNAFTAILEAYSYNQENLQLHYFNDMFGEQGCW